MGNFIVTLLAAFADLVKAGGPPSQDLQRGKLNTFLRRDGYTPCNVDLRVPRKLHKVGDIVSLCDYLNRHGQPDKTTVFCSPGRFLAVIDDRTTEDGGADRDIIELVPEEATAFTDWKAAFGKPLPHVAFRNFLEDHRDDVADRGFIAAVKGFAVNQTVEYSGDLNTGDNITLKTSTSRGQKTETGTVELERAFTIAIPLVVGWEKKYRISVRVEADLAGGVVRFVITPRNLVEVMHQLLNDLVAHLGEVLGEGWLVVRGTPRLDQQPSNLDLNPRR